MTDFRKDKNVSIETVQANDHPGRAFAHGLQEKMGKTLCPSGLDYLATLTVHVYSKDTQGVMIDRSDAAFISVVHGLENCPETMADAAIKTLTAETMRLYGRKVPEWRKT